MHAFCQDLSCIVGCFLDSKIYAASELWVGLVMIAAVRRGKSTLELLVNPPGHCGWIAFKTGTQASQPVLLQIALTKTSGVPQTQVPRPQEEHNTNNTRKFWGSLLKVLRGFSTILSG